MTTRDDGYRHDGRLLESHIKAPAAPLCSAPMRTTPATTSAVPRLITTELIDSLCTDADQPMPQ